MSHWIGLEPAAPRGPFAAGGDPAHYKVTEFFRTYTWDSAVVSATIQACGDTAFQLFLNGECIMTGPPSVGGDFIGNDTPRDNFYSFEVTVSPAAYTLAFSALVQTMPLRLFEFSKGQVGFLLTAHLTTADGKTHTVYTGDDWQARRSTAHTAPFCFDDTRTPAPFVPAVPIDDIWHAAPAPIPVLTEYAYPLADATVTINADERITRTWELDRVYGGFLALRATGGGTVRANVAFSEIGEEGSGETVTLCDGTDYRGFALHSAGRITATMENCSNAPLTVTAAFIVTHYPVAEEAVTLCDDEALNTVLDTCRHTLKICRQTLHLDSTRHCEPLACTGDYYIESLMTPFAFGDMRLAAFDVLRTAELLTREDGRMFHTTYSLIWVCWLHEVYMLTGDITLLTRCRPALEKLLRRFETYCGANGLVETPPDYMFVDWLFIDGYSLHHPPKALGQSVLNMFYFGALDAAAAVYGTLGDPDAARRCLAAREDLRRTVNTLLFDGDRRCYTAGLNTPNATEENGSLPKNTDKRYFLPHANILAACFGVCDDTLATDLIHRVMAGEFEYDCQPYFLHFLFEAIFRLGLREQYTRLLAERWKAPVLACTKGLVEGFIPPTEDYCFDHSHAWGGTPLYSVPKALLGLTVTEAGMRAITLAPSLLGLSHATVELFTPYGKLTCEMQRGQPPRVTCPAEIRCCISEDNAL
ncbi:MAG: hypothetical protein E7552_07805 [Ruminococcaceae bacterium]|nr:hypothetical protein [Oscillospiraceae bacterium]